MLVAIGLAFLALGINLVGVWPLLATHMVLAWIPFALTSVAALFVMLDLCIKVRKGARFDLDPLGPGINRWYVEVRRSRCHPSPSDDRRFLLGRARKTRRQAGFDGSAPQTHLITMVQDEVVLVSGRCFCEDGPQIVSYDTRPSPRNIR